ncbi:LpqB family beta-propeller domain-containing protein [Nonomuraea sp. NPDC052634]|uniref:LpqB family beta-propeller domain-containing protein n=1 Tax=Nonomuraea sp. NPDC052634 TaxID=3155813 RepID=UPI00343F768A
MRRTSRLVVTALIAILAMLAGSGCTVIPPSAPYTVNDEGAGDPLTKPFQRMIAIGPQRSWGPIETFRGLQAAMAAYPEDPAVLQQYLTPQARQKWSASGPVTVIEDLYEVIPPASMDGTEPSMKITVKGRWVAQISEDDSYKPTAGPWSQDFELVREPGGGYRVNSLPQGLLLTAADVARSYRPTNLYYLALDGQSRLVVDRVRLRLKTTETYAETVLKRLLEPPTEALRGAVTTGFPAGSAIESIRSGEERVVINLRGDFDVLDLSAEDALRAQIRHSLNNNEIAKGRIIEVQVDGEPYITDRPGTEDSWLGDGGERAYYVDNGALHYLGQDGAAGAVAGAAGEQRDGYDHFAVSKDNGNGIYVAARTSTGVSIAKIGQDGGWQEVIQGKHLTPPTWRRDGTLWTYDRDKQALLRYDPNGSGGPQRVATPKQFVGLNITGLRIARDGVRVVVTIDNETVQIGALIGEGRGVRLGNLQSLTTTEGSDEIIDVAWADDLRLLVLVKSKAGQILNEINVGDGQTSGVPLKDRVSSLAALNDRILAGVGSGGDGKILELNQDRQTWTAKLESAAGDPLFPLG